ncbi:hypothetical protein [Paraburkholderia sp. RAU2J]|uniref:hypothetical protein n=1 Tax=Paraburkholderia sp. RAU2J TaxID=1938810 RepID=UPI0011C3979B|nr:hypothetical protein [Paraburkholderia sp. RAU2J]
MTVDPLGPTQFNQPEEEASHAKEMRFSAAFQHETFARQLADPVQGHQAERRRISSAFDA